MNLKDMSKDELLHYIEHLKPYCDNCLHADNEDRCDECHRKMFNWKHEHIA